jgi:hypothetical protein
MAWITEPEPRKSIALKKAWVTRWNMPATGRPAAHGQHHVTQLDTVL